MPGREVTVFHAEACRPRAISLIVTVDDPHRVAEASCGVPFPSTPVLIRVLRQASKRLPRTCPHCIVQFQLGHCFPEPRSLFRRRRRPTPVLVVRLAPPPSGFALRRWPASSQTEFPQELPPPPGFVVDHSCAKYGRQVSLEQAAAYENR